VPLLTPIGTRTQISAQEPKLFAHSLARALPTVTRCEFVETDTRGLLLEAAQSGRPAEFPNDDEWDDSSP
jgi:hypothetical protein